MIILSWKLNYFPLSCATIFAWKNRKTIFIQSRLFGVLKNEWNELSPQEKYLVVFVANDKIWAFKRKWEFWKTDIYYCDLMASKYLKDFSIEIGSDGEGDGTPL